MSKLVPVCLNELKYSANIKNSLLIAECWYDSCTFFFQTVIPMKKLILYLLFVVSVLLSCKKDEINIDRDNLLIGTWIYTDYQNELSVYSRVGKFTDNYCIRFNDDGSILERKNAGWCGTPPVTYADYEGSWSIINDTLIEVKSQFWGGTSINRFDIELLTSDSLKLVTVSSENIPF